MVVTSEKTKRIVHSLLITGFMSAALSGVFSWIEFGFTSVWIGAWGKAFCIAWPIALGLDAVFGAKIRGVSAIIANVFITQN